MTAHPEVRRFRHLLLLEGPVRPHESRSPTVPGSVGIFRSSATQASATLHSVLGDAVWFRYSKVSYIRDCAHGQHSRRAPAFPKGWHEWGSRAEERLGLRQRAADHRPQTGDRLPSSAFDNQFWFQQSPHSVVTVVLRVEAECTDGSHITPCCV